MRIRHCRTALLLLGLLPALTPHAASVRVPLLGDMDGDGRLTIADASKMLRFAVHLDQPTEADMVAGDLTPSPGIGPRSGWPVGKGAITVADATALLRHIVGLPGGPWADPSDPASFALIHKEILLPSCATSSCHNSNARRAGLALENPAEAFANLVNAAPSNSAAASLGMKRVVPGHPETSFLLTKLHGPPTSDLGVRMPYGTGGISPDQMARVEQWIANGARFDADDGTLKSDLTAPPVDPKAEDVSLTPPPPDQGFQVSVGPFDVPTGQEVQRDYFLKTPNVDDRWVKRIDFSYNKGSHHLLIFKSDTQDVPDHAETKFGLFLNAEWSLVEGAQNEAVSSDFPPGVGFLLHSRQQMDFQLHYVNTRTQSTPTGRGKLVVNFWYASPSEITAKAGFLFGSKFGFSLPPHQTTTLSRGVLFPFSARVFGLAGHYHSRGRQYRIYRWDGKTKGDLVYESREWDDPRYTPYHPPLDIEKGQGLLFEATYENNFDHAIREGPHAETEEHLFYFGWFYRPDDLTTPDILDFGF